MTNAQKAAQFQEEARRHLRKLAGVDGPRPQRGYFPNRNYTPGGAAKADSTRPGTFNVQYGMDSTDADVNAFIRSMGGNPFAKKAQGRSAGRSNSTPPAGGTAPAPAQGESIRSLIERMAGDFKGQQDAANAANESRYKEVKDSNAGLYGRVMGEVDNWGNVQKQLNEEQAKHSMGNIRANLASRGLTGSTIGEAFQARNDRDLALEQQALSEAKSARRLGYDIDLTNNANGFIERRTDRGPDNSALLALSAKLGEAEAYQKGQQAAGAQQRPVRERSQQIPYAGGGGVAPAYAAMMGNQIQGNFMGQLGNAMGMMQPVNYGPAYTSNRYPTPRGENAGANQIKTEQSIVPIIPAIGGGVGSAIGALMANQQMGKARQSNPKGTAQKAIAARARLKKLTAGYSPSPLLYAGKAIAPYLNSETAANALGFVSGAAGQMLGDPFEEPNFDTSKYRAIGNIQGKLRGYSDYMRYGADPFSNYSR